MSPNDVKELLDALIAELELPLVASDGGPLLVSEKSDRFDAVEGRESDRAMDEWRPSKLRFLRGKVCV